MEASQNNNPTPPPEHMPEAPTTTSSSVHARADDGDIDAQWEINLACQAEAKDECEHRCNGLVRVPLQPVNRSILSAVPRSMSLVDDGLVKTFRELTTGKTPWPLFLWGPAGAGKSRACLALCDLVKHSRYTTLREACDAKMNPDLNCPWTDRAYHARLVVVDELGTRLKTSDLEYTVLAEICDDREWYASGVAIYVSNLSPAELSRTYDDRIASRILCGTRFKLDGVDRRIERDRKGEGNAAGRITQSDRRFPSAPRNDEEHGCTVNIFTTKSGRPFPRRRRGGQGTEWIGRLGRLTAQEGYVAAVLRDSEGHWRQR